MGQTSSVTYDVVDEEPPAKALQEMLDGAREDNVRVGSGNSYIPRSARGADGRFVLQKEYFPNAVVGGFRHFLKWRCNIEEKVVCPPEEVLERELPVHTLDKKKLCNPASNKAQVTWLGHSSVLVQWDGWNVLCDPIFSERCSVSQMIGPKRVRPCPVKPEQLESLPNVDVVVISHNHYDHLDLNSVTALASRKPAPLWCVPLGTKSWMQQSGVHNVVEMDWSEEITISSPAYPNRPPLTVACVPCQHWCARGITDRNRCLWSSWVCKTKNFRYYFGGDTGSCDDIFGRIGRKYGPFSLSAIPIGAYGSKSEQWFHKANHMNPFEAVRCHLALSSWRSIGVHWGTFQLTAEPLLEPAKLLITAREEQGLSADEFTVMHHGETRGYDLAAVAAHYELHQSRPSDGADS